jgi:hypothetical protein
MSSEKGRSLGADCLVRLSSGRINASLIVHSSPTLPKMSDYRLEGLSPRLFEHLVQSLAQKHLGARTVIFGDGPDGAREAEFKGSFRLPPGNESWKGRVIVQAKFLQKPDPRPKNNTDWLLQQLDKEMKKFVPSLSKRKKTFAAPNYYVLATNVSNSGAAKKGGKDRLSVALDKYQGRLGWKAWILWDANEIARMLDNAMDIRVSYSAWITPGDVLAEMLRTLKSHTPDFERVMMTRLQEDFCGAQYAKLRQAGHGSEDKTPLSQLFVDLPVANTQLIEPLEEPEELTEDEKASTRPKTFLRGLIERGDTRLSPEALGDVSFGSFRTSKAFPVLSQTDLIEIAESRESITLLPNFTKALLKREEYTWGDWGVLEKAGNRIVLLGGPGQGKTTLGQFACQLYRAALLSHIRKPLLQETRDALRTFQEQSSDDVPWPQAKRYPIWIDLKELAKWLATVPEEPPVSLFTFVAGRLSSEVHSSHLKEWLNVYPWFVVFDGLDEVPPGSGRERMLRCIQSFVTEAHGLNADLLVLCTTRPQGYSSEFDQRYYHHQWLAPLSPARAMAYGEKVLDVRHGNTGDDRRTFGLRLKQATDNPMTARVMRSPLQVTIMAALVERVGKPPEQRWKLFTEYYSVIYERERERGTAWSDALSKYDAEIDAIHRRVGWRLQIRSERARNSDARLSDEEFKEEVRKELSREGHEGKQLDNLVALLGDAATERLVFLVALGSLEVGFEIRSLQEFMAADHLFQHGDQGAAHHLGRLGPIVYWRNVFLFAAGRVFAERRNLREHLLGILNHLNEDAGQAAARLSLAGSILALDLLEDGSASHIPASRDALMRTACRLLDIALPTEHKRLAIVGTRTDSPVLRQELERRLAGGDPESLAGARNCAASLSSSVEWVPKIRDLFWPHSHSEMVEMIRMSPVGDFTYFEKIGSVVRQMSPFDEFFSLLDQFVSWSDFESQGLGIPLELLVAGGEQRHSRQAILVRNESGWLSSSFGFISRRFTQMDASLGRLENCSAKLGLHRDWEFVEIAVDFINKPSPEALAQGLKRLKDIGTWPLIPEVLQTLPWPITLGLSRCKSLDDISDVAEMARNEQLGNLEKWTRLEEFLFQQGIGESDLTAVLSPGAKAKLSGLSDECGLGEDGLLLFLETLSVFATDTQKHPRIAVSSNPRKLVDLIAKHRVSLGIRMVEAFASANQSESLSLETFCHLAKQSRAGRLPVSLEWLEDKLLDLKRKTAQYDDLGLLISEVRARNSYPIRDTTGQAIVTVLATIQERPTKVGLWRTLSLLPSIPDPSVYSEILSYLPKQVDSRIKADVVALRISGQMWTLDSAAAFADEVLLARKVRQDLLDRIGHTLDQLGLSNADMESLPAVLLERVPRDDWSSRCLLRDLLRRLHVRRSSGLAEDDDERISIGQETPGRTSFRGE